eukprot:jgi/Ulvmu1/3648/UM017_0062.1
MLPSGAGARMTMIAGLARAIEQDSPVAGSVYQQCERILFVHLIYQDVSVNPSALTSNTCQLACHTAEAQHSPTMLARVSPVCRRDMVACFWCLVALSGLCALCVQVEANADAYIMPDLGYPEPDWGDYNRGNASDSVIVPSADQVWGDIRPGGDGTYCKWSPGPENNRRGTCKTDISWIHASVGLSKELFSDPVFNYFLRFFIEGACYRSTQYAYNGVTRYCATWWLDPHTNQKINVTDICYDMEWRDGSTDPLTGAPIVEKLGCAHQAPAGVNYTGDDTEPSSAAGGNSAGAETPPAAGAPVSAVNTTAQFVRQGLLSSAGMERWDRHQLWQDCKGYTAEGSAGRSVCQREALGIALGRDVPTLRGMLAVLKDPNMDCERLFAANEAAQNDTLNPEWCESNTADWVVSNMLPQVGLVGTPQAPKSLVPVISPPPPPPPPRPPMPPPPPRAFNIVPVTPDVLDGKTDPGANGATAAFGFACFVAVVCAATLSAMISFT